MLEIPTGYEFIALQTRSKLPLHAGWPTTPTLSVLEVQRILSQGGNYGVRLREGEMVIDVDPRNGGSLEQLIKAGLDIYRFPIVATPSGGWHIYVRVPVGVQLRHSLAQFPGIDMQGVGRYVVGPGSIHPNGGVYELDFMSCVSYDNIPLLPATFVDLLKVEKSSPNFRSGESTWSVERLDHVLKQLDPRGFDNHDNWFAFMCACHEATGGEAEDVFTEWSIGDELYSNDSAIIRQRWRSLRAGSLANAGTGTLLHILARHGVTDVNDDVSEFASYGTVGAAMLRDPEKPPLQDMNERFYCVQEDGKLRILECRTSEDLKVNGWIRHSKKDFLEIAQSIYHYPPVEIKSVDAKGKEKKSQMPMAQRWIESPVKGKRVYPGGVVFMPENPNERVGEALNMWRGFAVPAIQGNWSLLQKLTLEILCRNDQTSYDYVLNWLARAVQQPSEPARTAIVFKGIKGTGKGTLGRTFVKLFGVHGIHVASMNAISGRFNSHQQDKIAMFADEAYWAGDRSAEGIFKGLITEPTLHYEAKGLTPRTGRNCLHILMSSNGDWVVPAGLDAERRFAVFAPFDIVWSAEFFDLLNAQLNDGGYSAMLYDLLHRDISTFRVHNVPNTEALTQQKIESMDVVEQWIFQLLDSGDWLGLPQYSNVILAHDLQRSFVDSLGKRHFPRDVGMSVGHAISKFIPKAKKLRIAKPETRVDLSTPRPWVYEMPDLQNAKQRFIEVLGRDLFI